MRLKYWLRLFFSLPKTVYFCFRKFPVAVAIKLPVLIDFQTKLVSLDGEVVVCGPLSRFMIRIGFDNGSCGVASNRCGFFINKRNCRIVFNGPAVFSRGVSLRTGQSGSIEFGANFFANQNFMCSSGTEVCFGDNVLCGWNVSVRDSDGHDIMDSNGNVLNTSRPVRIGNQVWISSNVSILKGGGVADACVVGYGSLVTKTFFQKKSIIAGCPARILKENVKWSM